MRRPSAITLPLLIAASCWAPSVARAIEVGVELTLDPPTAAANELMLEVAFIGNTDTDTTDLSGTINAVLDLDVSPSGVDVTGVRFGGGDLSATNTQLALGEGFTATNVFGIGVAGQVDTLQPGFRPVTAGAFDASDHQITLDEGAFTLTGFVTNAVTLSETPIEFVLDGDGSLLLTLDSMDDDSATYDVRLSLPVDASQSFLIDPVFQAFITFTASGTVAAEGQITVPLSDSGPLAGDANLDDSVDAADYTALRDTNGAFDEWRGAFGDSRGQAVVGQALPAPEPGSGLLALFAASAGALARRR